ncbi:hypothetical protein OS175_13485 [Marinicella sp. S1101]|nr:hypothetical protein [Marinicella marina]MCX7554886.1 hypothetical protein [Marinicella marina]
MNKLMTVIATSLMMMTQLSLAAELPSWGLTESQYKLPNFNKRMGEIGKQAYDNNWQLRVTAPADWHGSIRNALTNIGERDVQMSFKDSVYQSISITAAPGAKIAKISPSSTSNTTVQKQVVIDKPQIDTAVEAPDFGETAFASNTEDLLDNLPEIDLGVPTSTPATPAVQKPVAQKPVAQKPIAQKPVAQKPVAQKPVAQKPTPVAAVPTSASALLSENREFLRKRHARAKRVEKELSYASINSKDELFIRDSVVLIKRFVNQGVVLYFWMKESYDPAVHKLVEMGSGKFKKDADAVSGDQPESKPVVEVKQAIDPTNLNFVAVDTMVEDQDELRREYIRNKRVDYTISANQLKKGDMLYIQNQTVLVERKLSQAQSAYYWLVGDTTITQELETKGDNSFEIK